MNLSTTNRYPDHVTLKDRCVFSERCLLNCIGYVASVCEIVL
jgi:hypothetical protein